MVASVYLLSVSQKVFPFVACRPPRGRTRTPAGTARPVLADPVVAADQGVELKTELKATLENTTSETRLRSRKIRAQNAKKDRRIQRILQVRAAYHCTRPLPPNRSVTQITKLREKATLENLTFETCLRTRDGITLRSETPGVIVTLTSMRLCQQRLKITRLTAPQKTDARNFGKRPLLKIRLSRRD